MPLLEPNTEQSEVHQTPIGRLLFPDYTASESGEGRWMKRVHLYVGRHQRLTGEVKKLPKPMAIFRRGAQTRNGSRTVEGAAALEDDLEITEIVRYKIVFSSRPEPVGD